VTSIPEAPFERELHDELVAAIDAAIAELR